MTVHSLLNRPKPYPRETLLSWLWRLARHNYYDAPSLLLQHLHDKWPNISAVSINKVNGLYDETALEGIAALTGYSVADIHQHTLHRFATTLIPHDQTIEWRTTPSGTKLSFLPTRLSKEIYSPRFAWCPGCVAKSQYVRLHWHLLPVTCCEIHHCWLQETCPQCRTLIRETDVICGQCGICDFRLAETVSPTIPATDDLLQLQATLMSWLYTESETLSLGFPVIPTNILLYVLLGLRYASQRAGNGWTFHHIPPQIQRPNLYIQEQRQLTVFERGCLYATAFRGLRNWPHGFFEFLEMYRQRPGEKEDTGLRREFGALYYSWLMRLWMYPAFDFIQTAFNDYLVDHVPVFQIASAKRIQHYPELLDRVAYLDLRHAAQYLGIAIASVYRVVKSKHLKAYRFEGDTLGVWFSRQDLARLREHWQQHITPPEAARLLGIGFDRARELIAESLLLQVTPSQGLKFQWVYTSRHSVQKLIQKLKKHTIIQVNEEPGVLRLADVCIRNGSVGLGFPQLLKRICDGTLVAYHPNDTLFPLTELWFKPETVANLSLTVKEEQKWMNLQEVEDCLGVGRVVLHRLIKTGLIQPKMSFGPKKLFSRKDVLALRNRYTPTEQAATLLNVPLHYIFPLIQHRQLVPLSGPGVNGHKQHIFDRAQLIAWHEKHIMRREMKTLVPDIDALMRLLKAKLIKPLVRNPNVYLRTPVMETIAEMQLNFG